MSDKLLDFGLCVHHGKHSLCWGWHHGFGRGWMPAALMRTIVHLWNPVACRIDGHNWMPDIGEITHETEDDDGVMTMHGIVHDVCTNCNATRLIQGGEPQYGPLESA